MAKRPVREYLSELAAIFEHLDPEAMDFAFDLLSDTLYVDFDPSAVNSVNVYIDRGWMVRVSRQTDQILGLQIENVLAREAELFPFLYDLVLLTEPEGFEPSPVEMAMRRSILQHPSEAIGRFRDHIPELAVAGN